MRPLVCLLVWGLRAVFPSRRSLALENLALRQQLAACTRTQKRPRLKPGERAFWVALSKVWRDWRSSLVLVKPATVIAWHRLGYHRYWTWKCGKPGRPRIPAEHIAFIRRISTDHPEWGEDRIAEELALKLGVTHSTSTIRGYVVRSRGQRGGQSWGTFVRNRANQIIAVDSLTRYTARFTTAYIFVVMHVAYRRIVLNNAATKLWLAEVMGIEGFPSPTAPPMPRCTSSGSCARCARSVQPLHLSRREACPARVPGVRGALVVDIYSGLNVRYAEGRTRFQ